MQGLMERGLWWVTRWPRVERAHRRKHGQEGNEQRREQREDACRSEAGRVGNHARAQRKRLGTCGAASALSPASQQVDTTLTGAGRTQCMDGPAANSLTPKPRSALGAVHPWDCMAVHHGTTDQSSVMAISGS